MRLGLALSLLLCATDARGQTCDIPNGSFTEGSAHWGWEFVSGPTRVKFPDAGVDGMLEIESANYYSDGPSRGNIRRELNCAGAETELIFRAYGGTAGQRSTGQQLWIFADDEQVHYAGLGYNQPGPSGFDVQISIRWPAGAQRLTLRYESNTCNQCVNTLRLDDFRFQAIETPILPVTWSTVKTRFR
jgi:hypothetical protein